MDVLGDILDTLGLHGTLYFRTDFNPPWATTVPELGQAARFHLVVQGQCHVAFPSGDAVCLNPGDLILIPGGRSHVLAHEPTFDAPPLETVLADAGYDGSGVLAVGEHDPRAATQMVCGHFTFREKADHPLLRSLPTHVVVSAGDRARHPLLDEILRLVARRVFAEDFGSAAAVTRLSEIVYIEILRAGLAEADGRSDVLSAFRDKQIGRAIELIHAEPAAPWTVQRLAAEVGMSRSRFADRFSALLGTGPMAYLAEWRLQKGLAMLETSRLTIQQIAASTGYRSPAAFTRAFSGKFGIAPRDYRQLTA